MKRSSVADIAEEALVSIAIILLVVMPLIIFASREQPGDEAYTSGPVDDVNLVREAIAAAEKLDDPALVQPFNHWSQLDFGHVDTNDVGDEDGPMIPADDFGSSDDGGWQQRYPGPLPAQMYHGFWSAGTWMLPKDGSKWEWHPTERDEDRL